MKKLLLLLLCGALLAACVDKNYDLENVETDNVTIGGDESEFPIPLAKILVSMSKIKGSNGNIDEIFHEADIWLPSPLPEGKTSVDLQLIQSSEPEVDKLLDALTTQMLTDDKKMEEVADLLSKNKYIGTFLPLLPPGTSTEEFRPIFINTFRNDETLRETLNAEIMTIARDYLTSLSVEPIEYEVDKIGINSDVVDMLANNLDAEGVANPKNTLHLKGSIANELPISLHIVPVFTPTTISFGVDIAANTAANKIPDTQIFADDLRTIVEGITIQIPVTLKTYYPGKGFQENLDHQIVIDLSLLKKGGLKLDI